MKISELARNVLAGFMLLLILCNTEANAQAKYDKMVAKVSMAYETGDYSKADKYNSKFKKKIDKKLGADSKYQITYYYMAARNDLANGLLNSFDANVDKTYNLSVKINKEGTPQHAFVLNRIASLLIQNTNPLRALTYVEEANKVVEGLSEAPGLTAMTELNFAEIYSEQGYYARAIAYIDEHEKYYASRTADKQTYVDENGNLKSKKLSASDVTTNRNEYAQLLNLKANTYRYMGNFVAADSAFLSTADWIDSNLSKSDIRYVENQLYLGQMLEENGVDPKLSRKTFENALSKLKKDHNESHYLALEVYESLLNSYLINDEMTRFKHLRTEYERVIKKYFSSQSLNYIKLDALEFNAKLDKDRTKSMEDQSLKLLASSTKLPEFHAERIKLYNFAYQAALVNQNYSNADKYLQEILRQKEHLFGAESPEYHLTLTENANFYMDFTDKLDEAGEIYKNSFVKIVEPQISSGHVSFVPTLNHLARYYEAKDELQEASSMLDQALIATRKKYNNIDPEYAVELEKIASLQINLGQIQSATENIAEALIVLYDERRDKNNVVFYVKALETQARLSALKGEFDDAADDIIRSQKLLQRADNLINYDVIASTISLADVYVKYGRISKTEELLVEAIADYEELYGVESRNLIKPLLSYGYLKLFTGEYTQADKISRRALDIAEAKYGENSTKTAYCKKLVAEVNTAIGDYEKAEQNINEALTIQRSILGQNHIEVAKSLSQLGLVMFYKGADPNSIEPIFDEAKNIIAEEIGNRTPMYADVLKDLSVLYIQQGRFDDAFNALGLAETIWETRLSTKKNVNVADIYMLTGDIFYQQKDYTNAELKYNQALKLYERFFSEEHPEYVRILSKLSKVYYMQGDTKLSKRTIPVSYTHLRAHETYITISFGGLWC